MNSQNFGNKERLPGYLEDISPPKYTSVEDLFEPTTVTAPANRNFVGFLRPSVIVVQPQSIQRLMNGEPSAPPVAPPASQQERQQFRSRFINRIRGRRASAPPQE